MPYARSLALVSGLALSLTVPRAADAANLSRPLRDGVTRIDAPVFAAERVVLRLRPDVARAAALEWSAGSGARPVPALDALRQRLAVGRLEPEFPGEPPGGDPDLSVFWIAHLDGRTSLGSVLDEAARAPEVAEASPVAIVPVEPLAAADAAPWTAWAPGEPLAAPAPNDSLWSRCYWLYQASRRDLHALEAWEVTRGDSASVIAIIDTGVLRYHPDLGGRVAGDPGRFWINRAESGGAPGVDDDGNGYVDDEWGWDYVTLDSAAMARPGEDWRDPDNDPNDFAVHGTAVAGVAAAIGDNVSGALGVAPGVRIMALRAGYSSIYNPAGLMDLCWVAQAFAYAARNGATVINCSFASFHQPDLEAAITAALRAGVMVVAAAGNREPFHYIQQRDDVLSVAASDQTDRITLFSTRDDWVDLAAPGQSIATTTLRATGTDSLGLRTPFYSAAEAGTSFSSPMVAAAAALLQSDRRARGLPPLTPELIGLRITETTDDISSLNPAGGYGTGRLNLERMLKDPPRSTGFAAGAATIGAAAIRPLQSGGAWIAHATADSQLLVLRSETGDTTARVRLGGRPVGGPAAADLGVDRGPGLFVALQDGRITAHDFFGRPLPGWPVFTAPSRGGFESSPALADLGGDGLPEVVWGGADGNVWAWSLDGSRVPGFPRVAGVAGDNLRLALADLDGLPGAEIVTVSNNDSVYAFRGDGTPLPGWPVPFGLDPTPPLIMRRGASGATTVVIGAGTLLRGFGPDGGTRFTRNHYPYFFTRELASGDLTGDGIEEVFAVASGINNLMVFDSNGVKLAEHVLDSRTFGRPIVGSLAPGSGAQVLVTTRDTDGRVIFVAYGSDLAPLRGWPKAGHPGTSPSLAQLDDDDATEIAAGAGGAGTLYLYDAGAGSGRSGVAGWPTARGNDARTGSRIGITPVAPFDDLAPPPVSDLEAEKPGTHEAVLEWSAPADAGSASPVAAYEIRVADAPIDDASFALARPIPQSLAPAPPGSAERLRVGGLAESATQWFALRSRDASGNWSRISNVPALTTATEGPADVSDLRVAAGGRTSLALAWTATGDDGLRGRAARYRVRWSESPIDEAAFEASTQGADIEAALDAGGEERATLRDLPAGARVWLRLRAYDAAGNRSGLSNALQARVGRLAGRTGAALAPSRSPASAPVEIEWQGGDAWSAGPQELTIFDLGGRAVRRFALPAEPAGTLTWDGSTAGGAPARAGIYFVRLVSGPVAARGRIVLVR